ncbi:piccolo-like 3 [Homarus americanus]|uniref:Piccolo-like 3 n=1 Tax=Homarus americanus TaxID=6706 RepID=A0A8J5NEJ0_HOMAM|nr:piccolo-like 3 [Homarus americanus]
MVYHHHLIGVYILMFAFTLFFLEITWAITLFLRVCIRNETSRVLGCWSVVLWLDTWKKSLIYWAAAAVILLRPHRLWLTSVSEGCPRFPIVPSRLVPSRPVLSCPVLSCPVSSRLVPSRPVPPRPVPPQPVAPKPVPPSPSSAPPRPVQSRPVQSCSVQSRSVQSHPTPSHPAPTCPTPPRPAPPSPALPCPALRGLLIGLGVFHLLLLYKKKLEAKEALLEAKEDSYDRYEDEMDSAVPEGVNTHTDSDTASTHDYILQV